MPAHGLHDILGVTAGEHAALCQHVQAAEPIGRVPSDERHDRAAGLVQRVRVVNAVPRKESNAARRGPGIADWERSADRGQHVRGVTALRVSQRTVSALMRGGHGGRSHMHQGRR